MKRGWAVMGSMPTLPMMIPKQAIIRDLIMDPPAKKTRTVRPRTITAKYSGGPKRRAIEANGGARQASPRSPRVPAMKDPNADMPRATPARPLRAIW